MYVIKLKVNLCYSEMSEANIGGRGQPFLPMTQIFANISTLQPKKIKIKASILIFLFEVRKETQNLTNKTVLL